MEATTKIQRSEARHGRYGYHLVWGDGTVSYMPDEATAKVYAAAPSLAEACRAFLDIEGGGSVCSYCNCHRTKHPKTCPLAMARAALTAAGL